MSELKPCPFCGDEPILVMANDVYQTGCPKCEIYNISTTPANGVDLWNRRVSNKDRELLIELSKPDKSYDEVCKRYPMEEGMRILKIRIHLEENP
jgi:hypothetical protein